MIETKCLKKLNHKEKRNLYISLADHFNFLLELNSNEEINHYYQKMVAYKNGYTDSDKMYKNLRSNDFGINIDIYLTFIKNQLNKLNMKTIKRFDDLSYYSINHSPLLYFSILLFDELKKHETLSRAIALYDVIDNILHKLITLTEEEKSIIPIQLIQDYGIKFGLNKVILKDKSFIYLMDYFIQKKLYYLDIIKKQSYFISEEFNELISAYIEDKESLIKAILKPIIDNYKNQ